jgi:hypothetical protein
MSREIKFKKRVIDLIYAIQEIETLTMCPSVFSDDTDKHDCDNCQSSLSNQSDCYDPKVCRDCWIEAIDNCKDIL